MAKTYAQMKTNVGAFVLDTSTSMATLIAGWINDHYIDISRRYTWSSLIDFDYTFSTVASTATYSLPSTFEQELFVSNRTDGTMLRGYVEGDWYRERYSQYQSNAIQSGTPENYVILREASQIFLEPTPNAVKVIGFPFKKKITALSGDSDTVAIPDIERIIEYGSISEALAYKKQYQKADYYLQKYENELMKRIGQDKARRNIAYQRIPLGYSVTEVPRMLGQNSYDTI